MTTCEAEIEGSGVRGQAGPHHEWEVVWVLTSYLHTSYSMFKLFVWPISGFKGLCQFYSPDFIQHQEHGNLTNKTKEKYVIVYTTYNYFTEPKASAIADRKMNQIIRSLWWRQSFMHLSKSKL